MLKCKAALGKVRPAFGNVSEQARYPTNGYDITHVTITTLRMRESFCEEQDSKGRSGTL